MDFPDPDGEKKVQLQLTIELILIKMLSASSSASLLAKYTIFSMHQLEQTTSQYLYEW